MGVRDTNKCKFCDTVDYIEHFFWACNKVKPVWRACLDHIFRKTGTNIVLSETDILFGYQPAQIKKYDVQFINHLILVVKMVISKFKYGTATDICCLFEREVLLRKL